MNHQPHDRSTEQRIQLARQEYEKAERWYGYWYAGLFLAAPIATWKFLHAYVVGLFPVNPESIVVSISVAAMSLVIGSAIASFFTSGDKKRRDQARKNLERIENGRGD